MQIRKEADQSSWHPMNHKLLGDWQSGILSMQIYTEMSIAIQRVDPHHRLLFPSQHEVSQGNYISQSGGN